MSISEKKRKFIALVAHQLHVREDSILPTSNFVDDLGADSLNLVEILMGAEYEFHCEIPDEAAEKIKKVEDAFDYFKSAGVWK